METGCEMCLRDSSMDIQLYRTKPDASQIERYPFVRSFVGLGLFLRNLHGGGAVWSQIKVNLASEASRPTRMTATDE